MVPRDWPTKEQFADRNRAVEGAAAAGEPWARQALAGLAALPPGTRGLAERFTYILTCAQSPLPEPPTNRNWGGVIQAALKWGILEYTGRVGYRRAGARGFEYVKTHKWKVPTTKESKIASNRRHRENAKRRAQERSSDLHHSTETRSDQA